MDVYGRYNKSQHETNNLPTNRIKDGPEDVKRSSRTQFWLQTFGMAIFLACPWLFHLLLIYAKDTLGYIPLVITGPVLIDAFAIMLYTRGNKSANKNKR